MSGSTGSQLVKVHWRSQKYKAERCCPTAQATIIRIRTRVVTNSMCGELAQICASGLLTLSDVSYALWQLEKPSRQILISISLPDVRKFSARPQCPLARAALFRPIWTFSWEADFRWEAGSQWDYHRCQCGNWLVSLRSLRRLWRPAAWASSMPLANRPLSMRKRIHFNCQASVSAFNHYELFEIGSTNYNKQEAQNVRLQELRVEPHTVEETSSALEHRLIKQQLTQTACQPRDVKSVGCRVSRFCMMQECCASAQNLLHRRLLSKPTSGTGGNLR